MPTIFRREPRPRPLPTSRYYGTSYAYVSLSDAIDDHKRLVRAREARRDAALRHMGTAAPPQPIASEVTGRGHDGPMGRAI